MEESEPVTVWRLQGETARLPDCGIARGRYPFTGRSRRVADLAVVPNGSAAGIMTYPPIKTAAEQNSQNERTGAPDRYAAMTFVKKTWLKVRP